MTKLGVPNASGIAGDQRNQILRLLRDAGAEGVSKAFLVFEKHFTQAAARIWELEKQGYTIRHESRDGERYVRFVLVSEPTSKTPPNPNPTKPDLPEPDPEWLPF